MEKKLKDWKIIAQIEAAILRFWWGQKGEERCIHWLARDVLYKPKWEGGLGLRNLVVFNMALLAKKGWENFAISRVSTGSDFESKVFL